MSTCDVVAATMMIMIHDTLTSLTMTMIERLF